MCEELFMAGHIEEVGDASFIELTALLAQQNKMYRQKIKKFVRFNDSTKTKKIHHR